MCVCVHGKERGGTLIVDASVYVLFSVNVREEKESVCECVCSIMFP